jgi:hypothetical protein
MWIRCDERVPDFSVKVLTYCDGRFCVGMRWAYGWVECSELLHIDPTHWMPLPEAPCS